MRHSNKKRDNVAKSRPGSNTVSYMSLYFRHKYTRVLNNIMINIYIEEIFYHTSIVIPEM